MGLWPVAAESSAAQQSTHRQSSLCGWVARTYTSFASRTHALTSLGGPSTFSWWYASDCSLCLRIAGNHILTCEISILRAAAAALLHAETRATYTIWTAILGDHTWLSYMARSKLSEHGLLSHISQSGCDRLPCYGR